MPELHELLLVVGLDLRPWRRRECGQPCNMAAAAAVGPLHQAGTCSGVHPAAHAGHGTLQVSTGPACRPGLPAGDLLHGAGLPAQVSGGCTRWGLGGQACGAAPLLCEAGMCRWHVSQTILANPLNQAW